MSLFDIPESKMGRTEMMALSVNPLFAFAFLDSFLRTLEDYLSDVTEINLKENFDTVYMVSFIDANRTARTPVYLLAKAVADLCSS